MVSENGFEHLPHDGLTATWASVGSDETATVERLLVHFQNEAWTVEGIVTSARAHYDVHYVVRLNAGWHVQQMLLFRDLDEPDLWLATDGRGAWGEVNGARRRDLGGCEDIDIRCSAVTRVLAIRRLQLPVSASSDVESVVVDPETLAIGRARLNYTRLDGRLWAVHRDDGAPSHEFTVDDYGLPLDLPGAFTRTS